MKTKETREVWVPQEEFVKRLWVEVGVSLLLGGFPGPWTRYVVNLVSRGRCLSSPKHRVESSNHRNLFLQEDSKKGDNFLG